MADVHNKQTRSYNMSQIRGRNTKPEILLRKFLFSNGFRYRLNVRALPGKPDIVLPKYKTAIFVNGCFWHGHDNCKYFKIPKTKTEWWRDKISGTKFRDKENILLLQTLGWKVITIWECQLRKVVRQTTLNELTFKIRDNLKFIYNH